MTISLFPRIFATLPSTAMRLAPSDHIDGLTRLYRSWRGPPQDGRPPAMPKRTNRIGRHLPTSGGLVRTLWAARELGCETIQIFLSNPQAWADPRRRQDADTFVEGSRELGISPVVAHAKYLINLASTSESQRDLSVLALTHELAAAGALGVDLVVVHAGSHGGGGEEKGMERLPVRLNDAKNELGSHRDGHRKVGEGCIPVDAWPGFFDALPGVPVVMETPFSTPESDSEEVLLVKKLAGGLRKAPIGR